jgi:hypothetical protein
MLSAYGWHVRSNCLCGLPSIASFHPCKFYSLLLLRLLSVSQQAVLVQRIAELLEAKTACFHSVKFIY